MAPQSRPSARHQDASNNGGDASSASGNDEIFIDPMLGSALAIYVDKDVQDRDLIAELIVVCKYTLGYASEIQMLERRDMVEQCHQATAVCRISWARIVVTCNLHTLTEAISMQWTHTRSLVRVFIDNMPERKER